MALTVRHNCPYCLTNNIAFIGRFDWRIPKTDHYKFLLATCSGCSCGVIFNIQLHAHLATIDLALAQGDLDANSMVVVNHWPKEDNSQDIPTDIPENIGNLYKQALRCISQSSWDAAGMTLRKVLEVSTKGLDQTLSGKTLAARIDALHDRGTLTPQIRDWAHEIRLDGNEAVHDDEPFNREQAENLRDFIEAYLRYIYTLPAMVERNRAQRTQI